MKFHPIYKEPSLKRRWLLIFLAGFCAGILFMNFVGVDYLSDVGFMSRYMLDQIKVSKPDNRQLFFYCLGRRLKPLLYISVFGLTMFGVAVVYGYMAWYGFSLGCLLTTSVLNLGIKGVLVCLASMLPHFAVYVPVIVGVSSISSKMCARLYYPQMEEGQMYGRKNQLLLRYFLLFGAYNLVAITGVFIESYVNPLLLRLLLKIF